MNNSSLTDIQVAVTNRLLEALQKSEDRLRRRINLLTEIVFELNTNGEIVYANDAWEKKLGFKAALGFQFSSYVHPFDLDIYQNILLRHSAGEVKQSKIIIRLTHRDGHLLSMSANLVSMESGIVGALYDVTEQIQTQNDLINLAHYDPLTKLPNRTLLEDRLKQAIIYAKRHRLQVAIIFVDLDNFKFINDSYGHHIGDEVLKEFGRLITSVLRESDSMARIGGDEFLILLPELDSSSTREMIIRRIVDALSQPFLINDMQFAIKASMGISLYPNNDTDAEQLIRDADQAMYSAKQLGKNKIEYYEANLHAKSASRIAIIDQIKKALKEHQFIFHYQPKVSLKDNQIFGAEALIRWQHPEKGLLSPNLFLPLVESHPLSMEMGRWAIRTAVEQISEWNNAGIHLQVNVNIGGAQLHDLNFYDYVANMLKKLPHVKPSQLQLEIVETSAITNIEFISGLMKNFNQLGVTFALDDFGTGYSSLSLLRILPIDTLKIDQSFISNMLHSEEDLSIIKSIIGLSEAFHCKVLAEGVETAEVVEALKTLGCHSMQGYYFSPPVPATEFYALLSAQFSA